MDGLTPEMSRRAALRHLERVFADAGLPEAAADARILVEDAAGVSRTALLLDGDTPLGEAAARRVAAWAARRLDREPVFRILGQRAFWGLTLRVTPDVLDPRPDTETIVEAALRALHGRRHAPLRLLDLGTGSGALLCALLSEWPRATGIGVDRSPSACAVARDNVARCGLVDRAAIVEGDWTAPLSERFDVVVSNPPYIPTQAIAGLDPEVSRHDPALALDGGTDGLDAYRALCPRLPAVLAPGGVVVFEVGATQAAAVAALLTAAGLVPAAAVRDLGGIERAVVATLSAEAPREGGVC